MNYKNNKITDYKTKLLNYLFTPYLELLKKESLENRLVALNQISSVQENYTLLDSKLNVKSEFEKIFEEIISEKNLKPQSFITIFELIYKTCDQNENLSRVKTLLNFLYEYISREIGSDHRENKFNFASFCILIKNICSLEEKLFLPNNEQLKVFCHYVKKEIPFYNKKHMIIKESLYLLTLMKKTDYIDIEALEALYLYTLPQINLLDINEKSLQDYIYLIKIHDKDNENKFRKILDIIENNLNKIDLITTNFSLDCLLKSLLFSKNIQNSETPNFCFKNFIYKIHLIPSYDISKVTMNLFESVIKNKSHLPLEYQNPIIEKLIDNILSNFEEISLFKYSTIKLYFYLNEIIHEKNLNNNIIEKIDKIKKLLNHEKNLNFVFKGVKILVENKTLKFNNSTLKSILELISKGHVIDNKLSQNYQENIIITLYIILKNQKIKSTKNLDISIIQEIFNIFANQNITRSDLKYNMTMNILRTFTDSNLFSPSLIRLFEIQITNKLITSKQILNKKEIFDLILKLESASNLNYPSLNYIKAKLI